MPPKRSDRKRRQDREKTKEIFANSRHRHKNFVANSNSHTAPETSQSRREEHRTLGGRKALNQQNSKEDVPADRNGSLLMDDLRLDTIESQMNDLYGIPSSPDVECSFIFSNERPSNSNSVKNMEMTAEPKGIINNGLECFGISCVQALFGCQLMIDRINSLSISTNAHRENKVIAELKKLGHDYCFNKPGEPIEVTRLIKELEFSTSEQHDPDEMLLRLFDIIGDLWMINIRTARQCTKCANVSMNDCLNNKLNLIPFGFQKESLTLSDLLQNQFHMTQCSVQCSNLVCTSSEGFLVEQNFIIEPLPELLVFGINLFANPEEKFVGEIEIPDFIDITPFIENAGNKVVLYELQSTIYHTGISTQDGHYIAVTKRGGVSYVADDNEVYLGTEDLNSRFHPYLVFYKKI